MPPINSKLSAMGAGAPRSHCKPSKPDQDGKVVLSRHEKAVKEMQSMNKISTMSSSVSPNAALPCRQLFLYIFQIMH